MKTFIYFLLLINIACTQNMKPLNSDIKTEGNYNPLTAEEENVIIHKGTERPYTGVFYEHHDSGTYICKRCNAPLFNSTDKFNSGCGWPSFDDEIEGAVTRKTDTDGKRTEILCSHCGAHLGHVFEGEGFTVKNTRHCVNSISLKFISQQSNNNQLNKTETETDTAIFAGGCFWGVEYYFGKQNGVLSTEVGYIGGTTINPTYTEVCEHTTGHAEAVRVIYDPAKVNFETLARLFFEIHDPTQYNRQGPDVGDQYRSEVFYLNTQQQQITNKLITQLQQNGYNVKTLVSKATPFYKAETYHQQYYQHKGTLPYCHAYIKRF